MTAVCVTPWKWLMSTVTLTADEIAQKEGLP